MCPENLCWVKVRRKMVGRRGGTEVGGQRTKRREGGKKTLICKWELNGGSLDTENLPGPAYILLL